MAPDFLEMAAYVSKHSMKVTLKIVGGGGWSDEDWGPFYRALRS